MRSETFIVALDALRANKVRAVLTMLGVVIGSACIVLVVTVALTGRRYVLGQIEAVGSNLIYAEYVENPQQPRALSYQLTPADLEAVRAGIPEVKEAAGNRALSLTVVVHGIVRPVTLVGVTEGYQSIRNLVVLRGRFFDHDDFESPTKVCLITQELADRVFPQEDPVGKPIRVGELRFTVIGVFRERVATFGLTEIQPESVIIPFSLMKYYTGENVLGEMQVQARTPEDVPLVTQRLGTFLSGRHPAGAEYAVRNLSSILDAARKISWALTVVLLTIAFIALLISGVGIMNIMLVTVTERTREIGIRRAMGARRREVLYQFLIEAVLISGIGAVIGILIAVSVPVAVQPLLPGNLRLPVSWVSVVVAFLVSSFTGVLFGYLPANRAAKLQPTESLRYE